jgi:hypothetical protein
MELTPPDDTERTPAQGFQSEGAEHVPEVAETLLPAATCQHEDDELVERAEARSTFDIRRSDSGSR